VVRIVEYIKLFEILMTRDEDTSRNLQSSLILWLKWWFNWCWFNSNKEKL